MEGTITSLTGRRSRPTGAPFRRDGEGLSGEHAGSCGNDVPENKAGFEMKQKAIGPQGAIAMPGPALPSPPTVSAVPPTVPALEEKSPPEVTTAQSQELETAGEGRVEEAEGPPDQGA